MLQAVLALTQRADPAPHGGHLLADREIDALHEGGIDLPTTSREHLLDSLKGSEHHTVWDADQAPAPHGLHHLRIAQPGLWYPAGFRRRALCPLADRLDPLAIVRQQRRHVLAKPVSEKQRGTVGGQDLRDMVDHALRHGERAIADVECQQQFTLGVYGDPDPLRATLQALDGLSRTALTLLDRAEQRTQLIQLHLPDPHVVQEVL